MARLIIETDTTAKRIVNMQAPRIVWLAKGRITSLDVADMWALKIGDPEFRLLDHPTNPSYSSDHATHRDAMQYAKAQGLAVVDLT